MGWLSARVPNIEERPVVLRFGGGLNLLQFMHDLIEPRQMGKGNQPFRTDQLADLSLISVTPSVVSKIRSPDLSVISDAE